jgi:hypothetical protein
VVDGEIAEKLERRVGWMAQDRAAQLAFRTMENDEDQQL